MISTMRHMLSGGSHGLLKKPEEKFPQLLTFAGPINVTIPKNPLKEILKGKALTRREREKL
jgi:hypothetical protein